jgi:hypothetical protein
MQSFCKPCNFSIFRKGGKMKMKEKGKCNKRGCRLSNVGTAVFLFSVVIAFVSLAVAPVIAQEAKRKPVLKEKKEVKGENEEEE